MADSSFTPKQYLDYLSEFSSGVNSGIAPILLSKNQLAFALNSSIRGGFIKPRPPLQVQTFNFGDDDELQALVETGKFQGGEYYRPDYGPESLLAQISGHLILFTATGTTWSVSDVSISGDLNSTVPNQVWMWQSEKWMIIQDGTGALPIFFDGTTSRRSFGPSQVWGVTSVAVPAIPSIGNFITVSIVGPGYIGPYNVPVIFNGAFYQPVKSSSGYDVSLQNINAPSGMVVAVNSDVLVDPNQIGSVTIATSTSETTLGAGYTVPSGVTPPVPSCSTCHCNTRHTQTVTLQLSSVAVSIGDSITVNTNNGIRQFSVTSVDATNKIINANRIYFSSNNCQTYPEPPNASDSIAVGTLVQFASNRGPVFTLAQTAEPFTVPISGAQIITKLNMVYTGLGGQLVLIGGYQYVIFPSPTTSDPLQLILQNLTDTGVHAAPIAAGSEILSVPEIPAGRMGAYGMGCNACSSVDGLSFIIGDVVGSGAGTQANNYRDAVLKTVSNDFLAGGGSFRLPGTGDIITSMIFPPNLDTSLGQGPLQIGTAFSIFSNIVPGADPATWQTITNPIQTESLKDNGPLGQNSTTSVNSDTFFRSEVGIGSLILARRDFNQWGNKSISNEMQRVLDLDDQSLLSYGSGESFDNRSLNTVSPVTAANGIIHRGLISMNLDLLSSLRTSLPPAWEGLWTGINIFQTISGRVSGSNRTFAFTRNFTTSKNELYEILSEKTTQYRDNGDTRIVWAFETPVLFGSTVKSPVELSQLREGEVYLSNIKGTVNVDVYYRPDYYPCWVLWRSFEVCQSSVPTNAKPGYRMRIGLGQPSVEDCEPGNNRPLRTGYFFQCRVVVTGSCTWKGMKASAMSVPQSTFAPVECEAQACQEIDCDLPDDFALYRLQGSQD